MPRSRKPSHFESMLPGLLGYYATRYPPGFDKSGRLGFSIGRQMVGLYLIEVLLKYAMNPSGRSYGRSHNLHAMFMQLSRLRRRVVERKYTEILNSQTNSTWDIAATAQSLLHYLGDNPITDTRYYWERDRAQGPGRTSILFAPGMIRPLVYALAIVLHKYPSEPFVRKYNTTFQPLAESVIRDIHPAPTGEASDRKPKIGWMSGLIACYEMSFPRGLDDSKKAGFAIGGQVVGLYLAEMLLKYAVDPWGSSHGWGHDLLDLFRQLQYASRRAVEQKYMAILNSQSSWALDIEESAESLLRYLGDNPITDTRYYWESGRTHVAEHASILFAPKMLRPLVYALAIVFFDYPDASFVKRFDTTFHSLAELLERDRNGGEEQRISHENDHGATDT